MSTKPIARLHRAVLEVLEVRRLLAVSIVVDNAVDENDDNGKTSLREAIFIAEGTAGSDLIVFDPTAFPASSLTTIALVGGPLFTNDTTGTITIDGESGNLDRIKISGPGLDRVFEIQTSAHVTLKDLTVADGLTHFVGGGIFNAGTLLLDNVTVRDNKVTGVPGVDGDDTTPAIIGGDAFGGGVFNDDTGSLTIRDSFFTTNNATGGNGGNALAGNSRGGNAFGAAVYTEGNLTIEGSTNIAFNQATGGNGGTFPGANGASGGFAQGGALYATLDAVVSLQDTSFGLNVAQGGNGGAGDGMHSGGNGGNAAGGAIYSLSDDFTVLASTAFGNSRANGGDAGNADSPGIGGPAEGGAIFNGGTMSVTGAGFSNDRARGGVGPENGGAAAGGAIQNTGTLLLDDVTITEARAAGGLAGVVGGIAFGGAVSNSASLTIRDSTLSLCVAAGGLGFPDTSGAGGSAFGGAVFSNDDFTLTRSTLADNSATGGNGGDPDLGPTAPGGNGGGALGGGLYLGSTGGSTPTITDSTLSGNTASGGNGGRGSDGGGGGVTGDAGGAGGLGGLASGGAIYLATAADIDNSTLYGNTAAGGNGGHGGDGGNGTLLGGAGGAGGAGALGRGAGIFMDNTQLDAVNTTISFNTAQGGQGGNGGNGGLGDLLGGSGGAGGNGADSVAGGIFITDVLNLTNTIVSDNIADTGPDLNGPVTLINSLVSTPAGDYTVLAGSANNLLNTPADLGPLHDNGGPTKTAAPDASSAAVNAGNNAAATAAGLTFDQRGLGFARISQSVVDIGAVELQAPVLTLIGNGRTIPEDDLTPSSLDFTDFGTAKLGTPIDRTFTIRNDGGATLNLGFIILPFGFEVLSPFAPTVAPGNSTNFTVRFNPGLPGSFGGNVQISNNTTQNARFDFTIAATANGNSFRVNFQPAASEVPSGYLADFGSVFGNRGNGYSYGFNQSIASATRDRNAVADQAFDTLVHTQKYGTRTWEVSVPNGMYQVHLVVGDASFFDGIYKVNVEGVLTVSGTPSSAKRFFEGTKTVNVTDGKLTISNAAGATNNKLDFVEITPVVPPPPPPIKINFQPSGAPLPSGFLKDSGAVFGNRGNGQSYGWNSSASTFARDRNVLSDQARDTLIHTQLFGTRVWELAVPNGSYSVHLVAGDPSFFDSVYKYNVEGTLTVNGTPTSGNRFVEGTRTVVVSDGKLTVTNAAGSVNNKIDFIEVTPL